MTTPTTPTTILTDDIRAKRVAVARDVIARIEAGKLTLASGRYLEDDPDVSPDDGIEFDIDDLIELGGDLQPHVDQVEAHCTVCALGAVLLSKARVMDAVPVGVLDFPGQADFHRALSDVFDVETLLAIESAFEQMMYGDSDLSRGAAKFGWEFGEDDDRCVAVMEKIVEGNGDLAIPGMTEEEYDAWGQGDDDMGDDFDDDDDDDDDDYDDLDYDDDDLYDEDDLDDEDDDSDDIASPAQLEPV